MTTVFCTITLADAERWPEVNQAAVRCGASAAVLQGHGPALTERLSELSDHGVADVTLIGVTFEEGGVPTSWIGHVARWWLSRHPDAGLRLRLVPTAVRGLPSGVDLGLGRDLRARGEGLTNETWESVPPVRSQVLVCRGPRCTAKGAGALIEALGQELGERGLLDRDVLLTQTGCLFPCNRAPVVAVQPDMAWLGPVSPAEVSLIVDVLDGASHPGTPRAHDHQVGG